MSNRCLQKFQVFVEAPRLVSCPPLNSPEPISPANSQVDSAGNTYNTYNNSFSTPSTGQKRQREDLVSFADTVTCNVRLKPASRQDLIDFTKILSFFSFHFLTYA